MSLVEILDIGLIADEEKRNGFINSLQPKLAPNQNVFVYVSQKHGSGTGRYSVLKSTAIGKDIEVDLVFKVGTFEAGVSALNQRVLFLQAHNRCQIKKVSIVKRD